MCGCRILICVLFCLYCVSEWAGRARGEVGGGGGDTWPGSYAEQLERQGSGGEASLCGQLGLI